VALKPTRDVLPNGVTVLVKPNHTTPAVSLLVAVRAGAFQDPSGREGTAALTARVLDRGTSSRTAGDIADALDGRGASLTVSAGRHQTALTATALAEDFAEVLALAADIIRNPIFPERDVATRRAELITAIRQDEDQPATVAVERYMQELYGAHPYARRPSGTPASVATLTRSELTAFHHEWFHPSAVVVAVVGDVAGGLAIDEVSRRFGDWRARAETDRPPEVPDANRPTERRLRTVPMPSKAQADIAYGFVGIRRADPDFFPVAVMNNALGQYALGGRLGDSIRERQGMAYYVFSALEASVGEGPLTIRAGVSSANVGRAIASIDAELLAIRSEGFRPKEIDESKGYLVGSLPRQLETNSAIASFLVNAELFGLGLDFDERLPGLVQAVTLDHANAAARRLLDPARATIVVAGPVTEPGH
jgi:zinc protease